MGKRPPAPGQSLVEFALLLPILTMLLFGIIEVSIVLTAYVNLTNSAREAARAGSVYQETSALTSQSDVAGMDGRRLTAIRSRPGSRSTCRANGPATGGAGYGSPRSGPLVASSRVALSRTDRVTACSATNPENTSP